MARRKATSEKSGGTSGRASTMVRRKIALFFGDVGGAGLSGEGLAVLPGIVDPINAQTVRKEMENCGGSMLGAETIVQMLQCARSAGRLLMGWSKPRAKDRHLTWAEWDAFVLRWCGAVEYHSDKRGEHLDGEVLGEEVTVLVASKKLELVGSVPTPIASSAKKA